jgi:hypothetical protein
VEALDKNEQRVTQPGDQFSAAIYYGQKLQFSCPITDNKDGTYSFYYEITRPGTFTLEILLNEKHIQNSPYSVKVIDPTPPPDVEQEPAPVQQPPLKTCIGCGKGITPGEQYMNMGTVYP